MKRLLVLVACLALPAWPVSAQDPVEVDSKHYKTVLENDQVRVLRVTYGPGEKSVMHEHPAGVAIFMVNQKVRFHLPDGSTEENEGKAGEVIWAEAVEHQPENVGDGPIEVILVELKKGGS